MNNVLYTLDIVAPVFLTILLGALLRRGGMLPDDFVKRSSTLVFYVGLPAMIAAKMAVSDFSGIAYPVAAGVLLGVTLLFFAASWALSVLLTPDGRSRGAFIQGSVRGNVAIVGLPILAGMMGDEALAKGVFFLAVLLPVFNVLAVVALSVPVHAAGTLRWRTVGRDILTNPLILSVAAGIVLSLLPLTLPSFVLRTADYLGQMTFPLALLGIGAGINLASIRKQLWLNLWACALKTVLIPLSCVALAWALGVDRLMLPILFVVAGVPTAVASFIMVKAMDGDADLAGGIVAASTMVSAVTISAAILVFRTMGLL